MTSMEDNLNIIRNNDPTVLPIPSILSPDQPPPGSPGTVQDPSAAKSGNSLPDPKVVIRSSSVSGTDTGLDVESLATEYVWGPVSPSVQEKIDQLQQQSSGSKFFNMTPLDTKRKSEGSPEDAALSRKEKKILKSEEKKLRKQEYKAGRTFHVQNAK